VRLTEKYFGDMQPAKSVADALQGGESMSEQTSDPSFALPPSSLTGMPGSTARASRLLSKVPFFKNLSTSTPRSAQVQPITPEMINAPAKYTGGFISLPPQPPSPNPEHPTFTHVHIAFEGLPISSPDIYALATLQTLLGGGGSFSAGGPGKGMYSRLYTNVLNQHGWVESCIAFNHSYKDSGLFGISASCSPQRIRHMVDEIAVQLSSLTSKTGFFGLKKVEVERAKNQLRSSLLMNLESRMVELEDLGRQVQMHGRKVPVREMCDRIQALTVDDLARVADRVLTGKVRNPGEGSGAPTVVLQRAMTPVAGADITWDEVQDRLHSRRLGRKS
jgi:processing peptidase subunit alpha